MGYSSWNSWSNHAHALHYYRTIFLPMLPDGFEHLEVGQYWRIAALDCERSSAWPYRGMGCQPEFN